MAVPALLAGIGSMTRPVFETVEMNMKMRIPFHLEHRDRIVPHDGEDNGGAIAVAAALLLKSYEERGARREYFIPHVAQLYCLAADAYEAGAAASIGHNRTDRYMRRAAELRQLAEDLYK